MRETLKEEWELRKDLHDAIDAYIIHFKNCDPSEEEQRLVECLKMVRHALAPTIITRKETQQ